MGKLLQAGRYEIAVTRDRRVATPSHKGYLLETMEEGQNKDKETAES